VIRLFLIALCLLLGLRLLTASPHLVETYLSWGVSREQMIGAGLLQILSAVLLLLRKTELIALVGLWSLVVVGLFTHWQLNHDFFAYLPGSLMGALVVGRAFQILQRKDLLPYHGDQSDILPAAAPKQFHRDEFNLHFMLNARIESVAQYLNRTQTFTQGQMPPYKVEFLDPSSHLETARFEVGILTNHFGPFLSLPGKITQIEGHRYRELLYSYGAYAISNRLFRPEKLQFWFDPTEASNQTKVHLRLTTSCRYGWKWLWRVGMWSFWPSFVFGLKLWSRWQQK